MKIHLCTDYAIRVLRFLHENKGKSKVNGKNELYTATQISQTVGISYPIFLKIANSLLKRGLLKTEQGRHGGYKIGKPGHKISVYEVLVAMEGEMQLAHCLGEKDDPCTNTAGVSREHCKFHRVLYTLQHEVIIPVLSKVTISDLAHAGKDGEASDKELQELQNYYNRDLVAALFS